MVRYSDMIHEICAGCAIGQSLVINVDEANQFREDTHRVSRALENTLIQGINDEAEQYATRYPKAAELFRSQAREAVEYMHVSNEPIQERVVCNQSGPTRFLGRCGAKRIVDTTGL